MENTTLTEATYVGAAGNTYGFYAVATDNVGNVQNIPTTAQASITVAGDNTPPVVANPISNLVATEDEVFNFTVAEDTFSDIDGGDSLTYTATLADGSELPTWLTFDAESRTFSGIPVNENVGILNIEVTATDNDGEFVSTTFELEVANVNDAPTLNNAIALQTATEDEAFSFTFAEDTFIDVDAEDSITYSSTLADGSELPAWLTFDAETRTFSGTPANEDVSNLSVRVTATDSNGESVSTTFELEITNVNDTPVLENAIADLLATEDEAFSFTIPADTFNDIDEGDSLTYTATLANGSELPAWLTFDAATRTFSGIPVNEDVGNLIIKVTATDNDGESISDTFELEVVNVNDAPTLQTAIADRVATEDEEFSFTFTEDTFRDVDAGDSLTYSATLTDGSKLPNWLTFDAATRTFNGTPTNENVGTLSIQITAMDNDGEATIDTFELEVVNVNDAPTLEVAIANQTATEDEVFSFNFKKDTFNDVDAGDSLTYSATLTDGSKLPNWLTFDAETRTFSGTPVNEDVGNLNIKVTATDNDGELVSDNFNLEIINVNDAPTLFSAIANQTAIEDEAFGFTFNVNTFRDVDAGDSLTYSATLTDGSELPNWLTFNAETRTFSGTPVNEDVGTLNLQVIAIDNDGESATDIFALEVINVNDIPLDINLSNISIDENSSQGTIIGNLSTLDPDVGDTHSYTLLNDADGRFILNGNLLQVASANLLDFEANSSHEIEIQTTDAEGLSLALDFTISLNDINEAPVAVNDSVTANQSSAKAISVDYLLSNDSDPENDSLSITAVGNAIGGTVSIDKDDVIFTPNTTFDGTASFEYTVSDGLLNSTAMVMVEVGVTADGNNKGNSFVGTLGDDVYRGLNGEDLLFGGMGNDLLSGNNGKDELAGEAGDDVLFGDNGNDTLIGGLGNDTLNGGRGSDSFVFNSPNEGVDTITDFNLNDDTLVFSAAGFGGDLIAGEVESEMFTVGATATSEEHRFIYDAGSGDLFYDIDGTGDSDRVKIAGLKTGLSLTENNFQIDI
ncbi:MAG: tandem-95 repeat protein [Pleurocapsa sp. SU_5_0]|nr:tandem-95 repeat protein [Pleurocapsa sp. SU_5_0]